MTNLAVIEAPNPEMEALAIAIAMREARHLQKSAALVTPDRALARRVMAALARWNLDFDDSGGDALIETSAGIFARLAAEAAAERTGAADVARVAQTSAVPARRRAGAHNVAIETLELALLRGTRPQAGTRGSRRISPAFATSSQNSANKEMSSLHKSEKRAAGRRGTRSRAEADRMLAGGAGADRKLSSTRALDFAEIAARHREVLIALSEDADGVALVFEGQEGWRSHAAFDELLARAETKRPCGRARPTIPRCSRPHSPIARCGGRESRARRSTFTARWNRG